MLGKFINPCEDSLTASVFTHLLHLPSDLFWRILSNACYAQRFPRFPGEPTVVDPWPTWDPAGTRNSNSVIPDLFMRFPDLDLIIEAKRWDDGMQNREQWQRELVAYANEYGEERQSVTMIALGGLHTHQDDTLQHDLSLQDPGGNETGTFHRIVCPVYMCRWERVLEQCLRMRQELDRLQFPSAQTFATKRIVDNLIDLFACHGFSTGKWFQEFDFNELRLGPTTSNHCGLFQQIGNWSSGL